MNGGGQDSDSQGSDYSKYYKKYMHYQDDYSGNNSGNQSAYKKIGEKYKEMYAGKYVPDIKNKSDQHEWNQAFAGKYAGKYYDQRGNSAKHYQHEYAKQFEKYIKQNEAEDAAGTRHATGQASQSGRGSPGAAANAPAAK